MTQDVVLVHGLSGSSRWWRRLEPFLAPRRARVVDLPRFGRDFQPHEAAGWLATQLEGPSVLVGHSLGGLVCATAASDRPELVDGLVLVAPAGAPGGRSLVAHAAGLARTLAGLDPSVLKTVAADAMRAGPEALALGALYATGTRFEGEVSCPTLLLWGARDRLLPVELAASWQRAIPAARLVTLAGAGHAPMLETPSGFAEALLEFLDGLGDGVGMRPVDGVGGPGDDAQRALGR